MADLVGKVLGGRYQVLEFLGRGGMSEVYKVWDRQRAVSLAAKVLREDLAEDMVFLRRFQREAEHLAQLQHPNIVRFYGLERDGAQAFILMDLIEGTTLRRRIVENKGPLTPGEILSVLRPVCAALYYAHQNELVHCDVKPANIMIDRSGKVLVTDFGIARMAEGATTSTMVGAGTPAYMAPEQVRGEDPVPQTDIYALGVVLYEMLTGGERPFTGEQATITGSTGEKVRWEQVNARPLPLQSLNTNISQELEGVVLKCLEKEPRKRFSDTLDLLTAAEKALLPAIVHVSALPSVPLRAEVSWQLRDGTGQLSQEAAEKVQRQGEELQRSEIQERVQKDRTDQPKRKEEEKIRWEQVPWEITMVGEDEHTKGQTEIRKLWGWGKWVLGGIMLMIAILALIAGLEKNHPTSTPAANQADFEQSEPTSPLVASPGPTIERESTAEIGFVKSTPSLFLTHTLTNTLTLTKIPALTETPDPITRAKSYILGDWISNHEPRFIISFYSDGTFETIDRGLGCDGKYLVGGWPSINGYRPLLTLYDHCALQKEEMGPIDFYDNGNSFEVRCDLEIICMYTSETSQSVASFHRK